MTQSWPDWPVYGLVDDIRPDWARRAAAGETVGLATLIATDGPSPRPAGAQMLVAADGSATGYVSGGCVEAAVAAICLEAIADGRPRRLVFGEGSPWFDIRLVCGTRIEVAVERAPADCPAVTALLAAHAARRPIGWVSRLDRAEPGSRWRWSARRRTALRCRRCSPPMPRAGRSAGCPVSTVRAAT